MASGYTVRRIDFPDKGRGLVAGQGRSHQSRSRTCLSCRVVLLDAAYELVHNSGRSASPYCSEACACMDADADILAEDFDDEDDDLQPMDEPR